MLRRIIEWSVANRFLVSPAEPWPRWSAGVIAVRRTPLEALPDLSDVQVIVQAEYNEQAPRIVEDQVTYPIAAEMLKVPGARTVRGYSFFGVSFVYVIFEDGTDLYWARSRVLEYLSGHQGQAPRRRDADARPRRDRAWAGSSSTRSRTRRARRTLAELRSMQDWYLRYALTAVPGRVRGRDASAGSRSSTRSTSTRRGCWRTAFPITRVMTRDPERQQRRRRHGDGAVRARVHGARARLPQVHRRHRERRGRAPPQSGTPIRVAELGRVSVGPAVRRGIADLDGRGDAVGGIVVMRFGAERAHDDPARQGQAGRGAGRPARRASSCARSTTAAT